MAALKIKSRLLPQYNNKLRLLLYDVQIPSATGAIFCQHYRFSSSETPATVPVSDKSSPLGSLKKGTGGRSSFSGIVATVFGASGFLGRYVVNKLGKIGSQVIIPYRGDHYDVLRLRMCGDLGQILFFPYHLRDEDSIRKVMKYSNVVINLVGRDFETKNFTFDDVHVEGPRRLARIARESGIEKFIHVSSLNANENPQEIIIPGGSRYLKSKARGEIAVLEEFPNATIFRPSDMFGEEDRFMRYYFSLWRRNYRWFPLWRKGEETIKQPVYVGDVATGIVNCLSHPSAPGTIYEAIGPRRYYLSDLMDWFLRLTRRFPEGGFIRVHMGPIFRFKVTISQFVFPSRPLMTWEKVEKDHVTDVVEELPNLESLGVNLTFIEDRAPWELKPFIVDAFYDAALGEFPDPPNPPYIVPE